MTGKGCSPNYFRVNANDSMIMGAVREFLKDQGVKKWDIIAVDYAAGRDSADKFKALVASQGGTDREDAVRPVRNAGLRHQDFGARRRTG